MSLDEALAKPTPAAIPIPAPRAPLTGEVRMAHGHQWRPGQHMRWWQGQAFGQSPLRGAHLLLAGHLHHLLVEAEGGRAFVQAPALEHSSTWWRHQTGAAAVPGIVVALTRDGVTPVIEVVRAA